MKTIYRRLAGLWGILLLACEPGIVALQQDETQVAMFSPTLTVVAQGTPGSQFTLTPIGSPVVDPTESPILAPESGSVVATLGLTNTA